MNIVNETVKTDRFSHEYPFINKYLIENGMPMNSRAGDVREILDFKTTITDPYFRCVGNNGRDINIYFLLAEALWIFKGDKDVKLLEIFNTRMKNFSDDGVVFHAPYGFRLRHHGVSSLDKMPEKGLTEENQKEFAQQLEGFDQIESAIEMLSENPDTRRVAMQIWNSDLDLGTDSVDIPCNDMVFLKIRDGKLITTIANRSNDLHWGLPTNVFQFSFLTEIMSAILGIELGTQTHNSQSLHAYTSNPTTFDMYDAIQITSGKFEDLYDSSVPAKIDFKFSSESPIIRLREVDKFITMILDSCRNMKRLSYEDEQKLRNFSGMLHLIYILLFIYIDYKFDSNRSDEAKVDKLKKIIELSEDYPTYDILTLAQNFFYNKIKDEVIVLPLKERLISKSKL